jgi:hypothetical protein
MRFLDWLKGAPKASHAGFLKCRKCGHEQRVGEWEDELDSATRSDDDSDFTAIDTEPRCLKCGSRGLIELGKATLADPAWIDSRSQQNRRAHP